MSIMTEKYRYMLLEPTESILSVFSKGLSTVGRQTNTKWWQCLNEERTIDRNTGSNIVLDNFSV
jgi:hypothetical protein